MSFTPIFTLVLGGVAARWFAYAGRAQIIEAALLTTLTAAVALAVFAQDAMPLLFLPVLPVILATFRIGRLGAAASVVIVALIGGILTAHGHGPINLFAEAPGLRAQFFQFYLAATVLTALPVAADLTRRREVFTRLRESEARLRESEAQLRLLTDNSTDIVLNLSAEGMIRFASPSIAQMGGYRVEDVIGRSALDLIVAEDHNRVSAAHIATMAAPDATQIVEYRALTGDGSIRWFETHSRCVIDADGMVSGVVCAIRDVSHRKSVEAELARAAATDPLTGLANRRVFDAALERQRTSGGAMGGHVALFDLDHFKDVNDRFGHAVGDVVLQTFARVARASVREGDLVARLGGEEFGIVLANAGREQAQIVCDRLRAAFAATPTDAGGVSLLVTASAGVAAIRAAVPVADTLEQADTALYEAKRAGRNRLLLAA
jgi:diguanylate cyclase (GGDEF)-like protein/PAS domain S-box-containing protein